MESNEVQQEVQDYIKLDYSLKDDPAARVELVNKIIETTPPEKLTKKYLEKLADYIILAKTVEQRKDETPVITKNRQVILNKRETSLEGFAVKFNSNSDSNLQEEDIIYNLAINDKNVFLTPRYKKIDEEDIATIPGLKDLVDGIHMLEEALKTAKGAARKSIKENIIELRKDQYILRSSYKKSVNCMNPTKSIPKLDLYENITIQEDGSLSVDANISLLIPQHVSLILCNYSKFKEESWGKFESDTYYLMLTLEDIIDRALADFPLYYDLLVYKIDGLKNDEIQKELQATFGIQYSVEYISSLWRNKIPKMIAEQAEKDWLEWHYTEEEVGVWKRCSRCGQIKLGHNKFFSKNKTSKDGWYSICKDCRNKKVGKVKE